MLDRNSLAFKVIGVFDIQHQDLADLFIGKAILTVKLVQIVIGLLGGYNIYKRMVFRQGITYFKWCLAGLRRIFLYIGQYIPGSLL